MKIINLLVSVIFLIMLTSCSSDNSNDEINNPNFNAKIIKQITDSDGYWSKYFYNDQNQLELITRTSNQIDLDSTYLEYNNGLLSRSFQRIYVPVTGIVNIEIIHNNYTATSTSGTSKTYLDDGTIFQDITYEFTFSNHLIKTSKFFYQNGTIWQERTYTHDTKGNLTNLHQLWYNTDGSVQTDRQTSFSKWDTNGLKTQSLLYWNYRLDVMTDIYLSNGNCLNRFENGQTYNYSFEYDTEGNVIKYNSIDEMKFLTITYYE